MKTIKDVANKIKELIEKNKQQAILNIMVPATTRLLGEVKNRIQVQGEKTDGSQIGQYSVKPMYATGDDFDKRSSFKPQGKRESIEYATVNVNTKKATRPKRQTVDNFGKKVAARNVQGFNFEERQSMYLPGGYKELRNIQGKPIDKVNVTYRGDFMNSYQQSVESDAIVQGLTSEFEAKKREGLEDGTRNKPGYGSILKPQQKEIDKYVSAVAEIQKLEVQKIYG